MCKIRIFYQYSNKQRIDNLLLHKELDNPMMMILVLLNHWVYQYNEHSVQNMYLWKLKTGNIHREDELFSSIERFFLVALNWFQDFEQFSDSFSCLSGNRKLSKILGACFRNPV